MVTYEQWNKAIASYFFEECEPDEVVFLQTNAETLAEIAERSDFQVPNAAESLILAVRAKMVRHDRINLWEVSPDSILWKGNPEEIPPQIAFLGLTVLAASLMESEGSVASFNYYARLNEVLFGQLIKGAPSGFIHTEFEFFWWHLQEWVDDQHSATLYLGEGSSAQRYVWLPRSQCLISQRDRRNVYLFFQKHGLTPFSQITDSQLEREFRSWLQSSGLTKIERYFSNPSYKQSILSQVKSLLEHWDAEIPPEASQNQKQATARVSVEFRLTLFSDVEVRYWFPRRGRGKINCKTNSLGIQELHPSDLEKWFQPVPDDNETFFANDWQLETDEVNSLIYTLGSSDIWIFRRDTERDEGWLSERHMQLYEDHLVVYRGQLHDRVAECLKRTCEEEIEDPDPIYVNGKEIDWLYLQAKPTKLESFDDTDLWKLSISSASDKRIRLIDGVSVKDRYGHKAYMDFCLPAALLPDLGLSNEEPLRIDDQEFALDKDRFVKIPNSLEPRVYQLTYGDQTKELRVISPERSVEHCDRFLSAAMSKNRTSIPTYALKEISELSVEPGIWLTGARIFGDIPPPPPPIDDRYTPSPLPPINSQFFKVPAHIISSVVEVAISFKCGETVAPVWLHEIMEHLDENIALRVLVEKKLDLYQDTALSYAELRKQIGK